MSEKLLPCPFCGPGNSCVDLWHDDVAKRWRVGCGACGCSTGTSPRDKTQAPAIEAWNRRTPAPEGEAVEAGDIAQMTCFANNHGALEDWAAWCRIRASLASPVVPVGRKEIIDMLNKMTFQMAGAPAVADAILAALRPVVPVGSADTLPPISLDGPHKIGEHRQWLARQLLDSRQDDAEAYSTVIYSPAMTDIWRDGVVPVGVSREDEAWSLAMGIPAFNDLPAQFQQDIHAAIIAALRPNDTGQSALQPSASVPTKREVRLVLAARAVAFGDHFSPAAIKELDAASEAYAADVPWADTPERFEPCGGCGEADPAKRCIGCLHNFATPAAPTDTGANHD